MGGLQPMPYALPVRPASVWRSRPGFASFLYTHLRGPRMAFRDALAERSSTTIQNLRGSSRYSHDLYDEAVACGIRDPTPCAAVQLVCRALAGGGGLKGRPAGEGVHGRANAWERGRGRREQGDGARLRHDVCS